MHVHVQLATRRRSEGLGFLSPQADSQQRNKETNEESKRQTQAREEGSRESEATSADLSLSNNSGENAS